MFIFALLCDLVNAASVVLLTLIRNVSNTADTVLIFNLASLRGVINAASVVLRFDLTSLHNVSNDADVALLSNCRMNNKVMSILVVC